MIRKLLSVCAFLSLVGCSHTDSMPDRPGNGGQQQQSHDPALDDASVRAVTPLVTLRYEDGGVIFGQRTSGALYAVDIETGSSVEVDTVERTVLVDNQILNLSEFSVAKKADGKVWITGKVPGGGADSVIFVTRL